jgi:hypothetical protein
MQTQMSQGLLATSATAPQTTAAAISEIALAPLVIGKTALELLGALAEPSATAPESNVRRLEHEPKAAAPGTFPGQLRLFLCQSVREAA